MATFERIEATLRDGRVIEIESARQSDAESILHLGKTSVLEHEYLAMYPDEFQLTLEDEYKWIKGYHEDSNKLALLARADGHVVAMINVEPVARFRKTAHIAVLGAMVLREYRNIGVGTQTMHHVLAWMRSTRYEKVELRVLASNDRAIHVYQKLGFAEEGRLRKAFKFSDSDYRDDVIMSLFL